MPDLKGAKSHLSPKKYPIPPPPKKYFFQERFVRQGGSFLRLLPLDYAHVLPDPNHLTLYDILLKFMLKIGILHTTSQDKSIKQIQFSVHQQFFSVDICELVHPQMFEVRLNLSRVHLILDWVLFYEFNEFLSPGIPLKSN